VIFETSVPAERTGRPLAGRFFEEIAQVRRARAPMSVWLMFGQEEMFGDG
jgi:hypothetical protein